MNGPVAQTAMPIDLLDITVKRLCIIGGSPSHPGGLEAFCSRALDAFHRCAPNVVTTLFHTEAAYIYGQGLRRMVRSVAAITARRRDFDLAWVQVSCLSECTFILLARALGWKVLVTPHFGDQSRLQTNGFVRWLRLAMMSRAHAVGLLFMEQPQEISLPPKLPQYVVGTFLPAQSFAPLPTLADRTTPLRLIHAARFSAAKGTLLMLDLCARLKESDIPFSARLVGRGDPEIMQEIARRIADAQLERNVTLVEWLDADRMSEALREADLLVHLSSIDSFPLIVLEALAADTLPVVLPMAGSSSMIRAHGGYCTGDTAHSPVDTAFTWLVNTDLDDLRQQGREAGKRARQSYGWPQVVQSALHAMQYIQPVK